MPTFTTKRRDRGVPITARLLKGDGTIDTDALVGLDTGDVFIHLVDTEDPANTISDNVSTLNTTTAVVSWTASAAAVAAVRRWNVEFEVVNPTTGFRRSYPVKDSDRFIWDIKADLGDG